MGTLPAGAEQLSRQFNGLEQLNNSPDVNPIPPSSAQTPNHLTSTRPPTPRSHFADWPLDGLVNRKSGPDPSRDLQGGGADMRVGHAHLNTTWATKQKEMTGLVEMIV